MCCHLYSFPVNPPRALIDGMGVPFSPAPPLRVLCFRLQLLLIPNALPSLSLFSPSDCHLKATKMNHNLSPLLDAQRLSRLQQQP